MSAGFVARRDAQNRHTFGPRAGGVDHPNFAHNFVSIQQVSSLGLVAAILPLSRYTDYEVDVRRDNAAILALLIILGSLVLVLWTFGRW